MTLKHNKTQNKKYLNSFMSMLFCRWLGYSTTNHNLQF